MEQIDRQNNDEGAFQDSFFSQNILANFENQEHDCELKDHLPQLTQLLHNEKMAPELLPFQDKLVHAITSEVA
jgi:hypothetical protein